LDEPLSDDRPVDGSKNSASEPTNGSNMRDERSPPLIFESIGMALSPGVSLVAPRAHRGRETNGRDRAKVDENGVKGRF
jgi:hypothetical protein